MPTRATDLIYLDTVDPTASEDFAAGYTYGDDWRNSTTGKVFTCTVDGIWEEYVTGSTSGVNIATGSYTGDGTLSNAITGLGFQPKYLKIWERETSNNSQVNSYETTSDILDDHVLSGAIYNDNNEQEFRVNAIISLDADGFTVSDRGFNADPNQNTQEYNYYAIG